MARNKNSTALFDVIHSAKKPPRPSPSAAIPTPKWWGKNKTVAKSKPVEGTEAVGKQRSWLSAAKRNGSITPVAAPVVNAIDIGDEPPAESPATPLTSSSELGLNETEAATLPPPVTEAPKRFIDRFVNRASQSPAIEESEARDDPAVTPVAVISTPEPQAVEFKPDRSVSVPQKIRDSVVSVDSAAGDIRFRVSYAGLVAIAFIFAMLLAIAFIAGKQMSTQTADDSDATPKGATTAPTAGLMAAVGSNETSAEPPPVQSDVLSVPQHAARHPVAVTPATPSPAPLPIKTTRDIGMVYVVVQSYAEQELAQKACEFMNHSGVPCSLVQGPANWAPRDWYSVIGLQPFGKHDPGLAEYERVVKNLGVKFTTHGIDQFQPQGYTWRDDSDLSQQ